MTELPPNHPRANGQCTLVGAGPGDPELLTLKAVKAIQAATVLLVDDLVNDEIVRLYANPSARIVHVGKRSRSKRELKQPSHVGKILRL